jgi:hypothetical protein
VKTGRESCRRKCRRVFLNDFLMPFCRRGSPAPDLFPCSLQRSLQRWRSASLQTSKHPAGPKRPDISRPFRYDLKAEPDTTPRALPDTRKTPDRFISPSQFACELAAGNEHQLRSYGNGHLGAPSCTLSSRPERRDLWPVAGPAGKQGGDGLEESGAAKLNRKNALQIRTQTWACWRGNPQNVYT